MSSAAGVVLWDEKRGKTLDEGGLIVNEFQTAKVYKACRRIYNRIKQISKIELIVLYNYSQWRQFK